MRAVIGVSSLDEQAAEDQVEALEEQLRGFLAAARAIDAAAPAPRGAARRENRALVEDALGRPGALDVDREDAANCRGILARLAADLLAADEVRALCDGGLGLSDLAESIVAVDLERLGRDLKGTLETKRRTAEHLRIRLRDRFSRSIAEAATRLSWDSCQEKSDAEERHRLFELKETLCSLARWMETGDVSELTASGK